MHSTIAGVMEQTETCTAEAVQEFVRRDFSTVEHPNRGLSGKVREFLRLAQNMTRWCLKAGNLLKELVEEDPDIIGFLARHCRILNEDTLWRLYACGAGKLEPRAVMDASPVAAYIEKLPVELQRKCYDETVPVVTGGEMDPEIRTVS